MYLYTFEDMDNVTFPGDYESLLDESDIMCLDMIDTDSDED